MVIYLGQNSEILWITEDDLIKQQDQFIDDKNCIVVDKEISFLLEPEDGNLYIQKWNRETQEIYLEVIGIKPPKSITIEDIKTDTEQLQSDNLTVMMAQAEQYEEQMATREDMLTIMAAIAELYEMNVGGVK